MEMLLLLRDTRQQISDLRQKTEHALACVQQSNSERRQQLEDIRTAKAQLNVVQSQLNKIVNQNNKTPTVSSEQCPLSQSEPAGDHPSA